MGTIIISQQTRYSFVEISVDFIERCTASVLELLVVFKDKRVVEEQSNIFEEYGLVHWNLDLSVYFLCHDAQTLIDSVLQVCYSTFHMYRQV